MHPIGFDQLLTKEIFWALTKKKKWQKIKNI